MDIPQTVRLDHVDLFVLALAEVSVDHDGAVVAGVNQLGVISVGLHGANDALELPRCRAAAGKEEVPRDVHLECGVRIARYHVLISGEIQ